MEITLTDVTSGYNLSKINNNFKILQDAINNRLVHRDGTNELEADLDFNSNKAINVGSIVVDGKDIIEEINTAYDSIEDFLITTDNLLREIEAILSGQLQDRSQGNGQYSTQLLEEITEGTVYTIPNDLQYIVGRNSLRISYQGVMCYPTYQYDEVGTFDEASNQIKFNITIPAHSHLNIWISGVGNIVQIKKDLEAAFAEYTEYVTNTKAEVEAMKSSVDASEANVTAINSSVQEAVVNLEEWNTTSLEAANNSKIWAEGTDEEVVAIGGEHSSKTWSLLSKEYAEAAEQIKQQIGTPLNVQGRVDDVQSLPSSGNKNGDMYFVGPEDSNNLSEYVWINNKWEFLGTLGVSVPDATESEKGVVKLATQNEITNRIGNNVVTASKLPTNIDWSKVDNKPSTVSGYGITDAYTKTEVDTKIDAKDSLPSQEGNSGKFLTTDGSVAKWEDISGLVFGSTVFSLIPLTEAGLHLLDGSLLNVGGIYDEAITKIAALKASNPNLFITEENWQSSVSAHGVCGKFVYTEGVSLRLPKVTGFVEGTLDSTALGDLVEAGLPNLVGTSDTVGFSDTRYEPTGCFYPAEEWNVGTFNIVEKTGTAGANIVRFDASHGNPTYGKSDTVQPQAIKGYLYMVVATATKTDIQVNIDNITTDLNSKADTDLSNLSTVGKAAVAHLGMPTNQWVGLSIPVTMTKLTMPADGYLYSVIVASSSSMGMMNMMNKTGFGNMKQVPANSAEKMYLPVRKGDVVTVEYNNLSETTTMQFYYAEGSKP